MNSLMPYFGSLLLFACSSGFDNKLNNVDTPALSPEEIDDDGDGFTEIEGDCNDANPLINPSATEVCDGIDNDCNTLTDDAETGLETYYLDEDGDGYGVNTTTESCDRPEGYVDNKDDCDDTNAAIHPEALEICDGIDNDCDAAIDHQDSGINPDLLTTYYADADGDNYGNPSANMDFCEIQAGYVSNAQDCNDSNASIHPDADEVCDGTDNNCNSMVDEADPTLIATELLPWFLDADGDGYGSADTVVEQCSPPYGYVNNDSDCDDTHDETFPGAAELESTTACMADSDLDGYGEVQAGSCCYDIEMTDSYGDSWNGGFISLYVNGVLTDTFANEDLDLVSDSVETQTETFCVSGGANFSLNWTPGGYNYEVSFELTNSAGTSLASESNPSSGTFYSGSCSASSNSDVTSGTDCDDTDGDIFPGAVLEATATECMIDADGDGYGDNNPGFGFDAGSDCDDNPLYGDATYPGSVVEANSTECMLDLDEDGFGDSNPPAGYDAGTDCDDSDEDTYWGAAQLELIAGCMKDVDNDGYGDSNPPSGVDAGSDCNDAVFAINSHATETWYDGIDQDCDGSNDYDQDGDGFEVTSHGGTDCNDLNANINPMALENFTDGIDNNCSGTADEDFALYDVAENVSLTYGQPLGITTNAYNDVFMVFHDGNGSIYYRKREEDGTWGAETSIPASLGFSGEFVQTKVDGSDQLQLAYTSYYSATDLYFNFMETIGNNAGNWSSDIFVSEIFSGSSFDQGFRIGFDIDSSNHPSFVFYDQDTDVPKMVRTSSNLSNTLSALTGTSMLLDNFVQSGCTLCYSGTYASMAIDSADRAHAVFFNYTDVNWAGDFFTDDAFENQYSYVNSGASSAECTDGNWISDFNGTYVDANSSGIHNSVAIRPSDDTPCVAYRDGAGDLLYACKDNAGCDAGWAVETVDATSGDKDYAALAFNSNSEPYIAYYNANSGDLRLAHKSGGSWSVRTIDNYGDVGNFAAIDIDTADMVHIIYYDDSNDVVKYAYGQ